MGKEICEQQCINHKKQQHYNEATRLKRLKKCKQNIGLTSRREYSGGASNNKSRTNLVYVLKDSWGAKYNSSPPY